ncbi:unnamed protein product [Agarophyton chilense]
MAISVQALQRLITDFPAIVPQDPDLNNFAGFLSVRQRHFRVTITANCSQFCGDSHLSSLLAPHKQVLNKRLKNAVDPHEFLVEVRDLIERALAASSKHYSDPQVTLPPSIYYERLLAEIDSVGWNRVESIDKAMHTLHLIISDVANRKHLIIITLPVSFPSQPPLCKANLPLQFEPNLSDKNVFIDILRQYEQLIDKLQPFFRVMDDFDRNSCVLEPERPARHDCYRRICITKHCSIRVEIDPRTPITGFPECRFLGSENAVAPYKHRLNQNIHQWDISGNKLPRENLEKVLEFSFPSRESLLEDADDVLLDECGICYSYRLEDHVPDIACDLKECSKPYHRQCLVDWLRALPDTRQSFDTITGNCVYCEHPIVVSMKSV